MRKPRTERPTHDGSVLWSRPILKYENGNARQLHYQTHVTETSGESTVAPGGAGAWDGNRGGLSLIRLRRRGVGENTI